MSYTAGELGASSGEKEDTLVDTNEEELSAIALFTCGIIHLHGVSKLLASGEAKVHAADPPVDGTGSGAQER